MRLVFCLPLVFLSFFFSPLVAAPLGLVLPTDNDAIFSDDPSQFYMYTDRNFEGVVSKPWSGGTYGFSRNQKRTGAGIIFTRLHEGIDIRPVRRDSKGEPLDEVRSIADGTVVYVSTEAGRSNYGRYVVVHHDWGYGPFFSLYAHLSTVSATTGQRVSAGQTLARMGYTGAGINKERAHVHVELNMILHDHFHRWHSRHFTTPNHHGIYNGINLVGMDIAELFKAHRANPQITIPEFLAQSAEIHFKVLVPGQSLSLLQRYPFLGRDTGAVKRPKSFEIAFAATGVPLEVRPSDQQLTQPVVTYVKPSTVDHSNFTMGRVTGTGSTGQLTPSGSRYIQLISGSF